MRICKVVQLLTLVLILGLAALTRAQQPPATSSPPPIPVDPTGTQTERARLKAEVVRLNTEVELLQLEHEAEWAVLLEALKLVRESEMLAEVGSPQLTRIGAFASAGMVKGEANQAVAKGMAQGLSRVEAGQQYAKSTQSRRAAETRKFVERSKKEFAHHAAELTEKRLEYADAEKRLNALAPVPAVLVDGKAPATTTTQRATSPANGSLTR